jgi:hypothetical protein
VTLPAQPAISPNVWLLAPLAHPDAAGAPVGQQSAPAVVLPEHPPKYWLFVVPRPHPTQLQAFPSGSGCVGLQTRIGS